MPCQREARPVLRVPVHKQKITRQREARFRHGSAGSPVSAKLVSVQRAEGR